MRAAEAFAIMSAGVWASVAALSALYDLRGLVYIAPATLALFGWRELRKGGARAAPLLAASLFGLPAVFLDEGRRGNEAFLGGGERRGKKGERGKGRKRTAERREGGGPEPQRLLKPLSPPPPPPRVRTMSGNGHELVLVPREVLEAADSLFA